MNSTFQKTLLATALSAILSTTAMAAESYEDTIDGGTNEEKQLNQHQQGMTDAKTTSDNNSNLTYSSDEDNSENRNKSKHQDNVLDDQKAQDSNPTATPRNNDKKMTHGSDKDNAKNRNNSKHQDSVLGENTEKGQGNSSYRSSVGKDNAENRNNSDHQDNVLGENTEKGQSNNSYRSSVDNMSSKSTALYSMSTDDLVGMDVVDTNGDKIGDITGVVLTQNRENAHAVINLGGIMGLGGRDVLASFDQLTMVDDKLRLHANQREIESMTDYGSENHVELQGDAKVSSELRNQ